MSKFYSVFITVKYFRYFLNIFYFLYIANLINSFKYSNEIFKAIYSQDYSIIGIIWHFKILPTPYTSIVLYYL